MRALLAAISFCLIFVSPADAKRHHTAKVNQSETSAIRKIEREMMELRRELRERTQGGPSLLGVISAGFPLMQMASLGPVDVKVAEPVAKSESLRGVSTAGLPDPLKAILAKVQDSCAGFRVISGFRPGARVRGSGRPSLHGFHQAADFVVANYSCAFTVFRREKFAGGYSIDPGVVHHIHSSWGGREHGRHFAHWQPHGNRYARRHGRHYARV